MIKGVYGLKEAAILVYGQLAKFIKTHSYYHVPGTSGFWCHETRPTIFCLYVDNIALKYYSKDNLEHFKFLLVLIISFILIPKVNIIYDYI